MTAYFADEMVGWTYGDILLRPEGRRSMLNTFLEVAGRYRRRRLESRFVGACLDLASECGCQQAWALTELDNDPA